MLFTDQPLLYMQPVNPSNRNEKFDELKTIFSSFLETRDIGLRT